MAAAQNLDLLRKQWLPGQMSRGAATVQFYSPQGYDGDFNSGVFSNSDRLWILCFLTLNPNEIRFSARGLWDTYMCVAGFFGVLSERTLFQDVLEHMIAYRQLERGYLWNKAVSSPRRTRPGL